MKIGDLIKLSLGCFPTSELAGWNKPRINCQNNLAIIISKEIHWNEPILKILTPNGIGFVKESWIQIVKSN